MRETLQPSQRTCHLRFSLVQLAHFLRVQLWLYADRRFRAALREEQDVDGHRAYLQRYLLLYHNYYIHTYYHYCYNHHPSKLAQEWAINACIAYTQSTHFQGLFFLFFTKKATVVCTPDHYHCLAALSHANVLLPLQKSTAARRASCLMGGWRVREQPYTR